MRKEEDYAVCDRSQLAARIEVRSSKEFYGTVRASAKRAQVSMSDYARMALVDKMALDVVRDGLMKESNDD
jgi:hypothetical protein